MTIQPITSFDTIARRVLYGLTFMYSVFAPVESERADARSQKKLHGLMGRMIDKLYENPKLLGLPMDADKAYEWRAINSSDPGLDKAYKAIFKRLYDFYQFLYITSLRGELHAQGLFVSGAILKESKTGYRPPYQALLAEVGITVEKGKTGVTLLAESDIVQGFRLLAEKVPVDVNPWTPYALMNFACCSFTGDFSCLLARMDSVRNLNGLLLNVQDKCLQSGYEKGFQCGFGPSGFDFSVTFRRGAGGFVFGYYPRKAWQFAFGSMNGIGLKAMLEDFENLDQALQTYLMGVCKTCDGCFFCAKGGRNRIFAVKVKHGGRDYTLCPDTYARQNWATLTPDLAAALFTYHAAQETYGSDWKRKGDGYFAEL